MLFQEFAELYRHCDAIEKHHFRVTFFINLLIRATALRGDRGEEYRPR